MSVESVAVALVRGLGLYFGLGLLFAVAFVVGGLERVDAAARGATLGFRLIVVPAAAALWPLLLRRWIARPGAPPVERNAHREAAAAGARDR